MNTASIARSTIKSAPAMPEPREALFHSVRAAIAFAYSICEFPIASHPKFAPPEGGNGRLVNMSAHEKHAQGALIRKAVEERLVGIELAVTLAEYSSGKSRSAAINEVAREVAKLIHNKRLGYELAKRHFSRNGVRRSQQDIGAEFGKSQQTISRLDAIVGNEIDRLRRATESRLEHLFVRTGIAAGL